MHSVAPRLTAGKDISNPGSLGTLGMLLEASSRGGAVDIELMPAPQGADTIQWLLAYQGCGFVTTCSSVECARVTGAFERAGLTCGICGRVTSTRRLEVTFGGESMTLFDFRRDTLGCSPPKRI